MVRPRSDGRDGKRSLILVQVLRALAATVVLVGHTISNVGHLPGSGGNPAWTRIHFPGGAGVDLFFAISGFIMVVSSQTLFAAPKARQQFLLRRAIRLVPLYWIVTLAYVPVLLLGRHGFQGNLGEALIASLLFIPYPTYGMDGSNVYPLYTLGWTLNYEVFFYLIFSSAIVLPRLPAISCVAVTIVLIAASGYLLAPESVPLQFWSQPIILEFGFGLLIGAMWLSPLRLNSMICWTLAVLAVVFVVMDPLSMTIKVGGLSTADDFRRLLGWGVPTAVLLLSAAFLEKGRVIDGRLILALGFAGECSYSLYLIHPFTLLLWMKLWERFQHGAGPAALAGLVVASSYLLAMIVHLFIERPLTRRLHRTFLRADPRKIALVASKRSKIR